MYSACTEVAGSLQAVFRISQARTRREARAEGVPDHAFGQAGACL
jgi:hypothetical protein